MFINWQTDKENVANLHNGILFVHKKKRSTDHATAWMNLANAMWSNRSQDKGPLYCKIPCLSQGRASDTSSHQQQGSIFMIIINNESFPGGSDGKESACSAGDLNSVPGLGRSCGEGNGNPLQYSCLENSTDRGAWSATVNGVAKSQTRLSN